MGSIIKPEVACWGFILSFLMFMECEGGSIAKELPIVSQSWRSMKCLLVFSQGFALSRDEYIIRELALCDWTGHHHVLFKYLLPQGVSYDQLSEKAKTRVDRQTQTVHGLPFEPSTVYNRQEFHPYHQIKDDLTRWTPPR